MLFKRSLRTLFRCFQRCGPRPHPWWLMRIRLTLKSLLRRGFFVEGPKQTKSCGWYDQRRSSGRQGQTEIRRQDSERQDLARSGGAAPGDRAGRGGQGGTSFSHRSECRKDLSACHLFLVNKRASALLDGGPINQMQGAQRTTTSNNSTVPSIRTAATPAASSMRKKGAVTS